MVDGGEEKKGWLYVAREVVYSLTTRPIGYISGTRLISQTEVQMRQ